MRNLPYILVILLLLALPTLLALPVLASSSQAYQDYLAQYDTYRKNSSDFQTAKNEYLKFQSLTSQTAALDKTKQLLAQRDTLFITYLLVLSDKLDENPGVSPSDKQKYQQLLASESAFLSSHLKQAPGTTSLDDTIALSGPFESHYKTLYLTIKKVLAVLTLGQLTALDTSYQSLIASAQSIIATNASTIPAAKTTIINQWVDQIQKKQQAYETQYASLVSAVSSLDGYSTSEIDQKYSDILKGATTARGYISDGASYLGELKRTLKYTE